MEFYSNKAKCVASFDIHGIFLFRRNDDELKFLNSERAQMDSQALMSINSNNSSPSDNDGPVDENIRGEILQLKQRLAGTDLELQRTNTTLRFAIWIYIYSNDKLI